MTEKEQKDQLESYAKEKFGIDLDKRKKLETLQEEVAELEALEEETKPQAGSDDEMNALALRIWEGQSVSLPVHMRVKRIAERLRDKGYDDLSALTLPTTEDIKRWL